MHESLSNLDHRPWALPDRRWAWRQSWVDLAFIHYPVALEAIRDRVPPELEIQEYDGSPWIGVVPFRMSGVAKRPFPTFWPLASFPELNVRTYVTMGGKPGVWFFSLDACCWPVVLGGRLIYRLPYHWARMEHDLIGDTFSFSSIRPNGSARFEANYTATGKCLEVEQSSFEHWATERYCLYSQSRGQDIRRVEVHHKRWPIQNMQLEVVRSSLLPDIGIEVKSETPVCHFSSGVDVVSYPQDRAERE